MAETVTLKDIAEHLGVSIVTVSNAMSGKKGVSDALRTQIREVAKELGYDSTKYEKNNKKGKKIGILVSERYVEMGSSFYWTMYQQIAYEASKYACITELEVLRREAEQRGEIPQLFVERQIDALVILGWVKKAYAEKVIRTANVQVVLMDFWDADLDCDAILSNNYFGMYQMTRYLLQQGHREIAFVGNIRANANILDRYQGYRRAMIEWEIPQRPEWLLTDRDTETGEMQIQLPAVMPTAFVCNSDFTAGILMEHLEEQGYKIPEDISVVGYDNYLNDHRYAGKITTYNVDVKAMASRCVKTVLKKLSEAKRRPKVQTVDGGIIYRSSVRMLE